MRKKLKRMGVGKIFSFTGKIAKAFKSQSEPKRYLIKDVRYKGKPITDHVWLHHGEDFSSLKLEIDDYIRFKSRIITYGRINKFNPRLKIMDYGLSNPIYMEKIDEETHFQTKEEGENIDEKTL